MSAEQITGAPVRGEFRKIQGGKSAMNHCGTQTLETGRLILRRLTMADAEAVYRNWASDPEVTRFLTWPTHRDPEVTKYVIGTWLPLYEKPDYYHWTITLKENGGEPIGTIHGLVNEDLAQITVGYCLGRAWWHRGITSEALQAVMDFFFEKVGPNSICSYHDPNNPHSGMVMKHCGMKYEGTRRASDRNNTGVCDISWYSILQSEYRAGNDSRVFYEDEKLTIRNMETADARIFTDELTAQGWHPEMDGYLSRLKEQAEGKCVALTAVYEGCPAGYVYVYLRAEEGPFKEKGWPIIVDFNVLQKYQRRGIGNRLMDAAEQVAGRYADTVCLGVGVCDSYGAAQRMYVKRGYVPDGSGVWYQGRQCVQYETVCTVDDDLVLFLSKQLRRD